MNRSEDRGHELRLQGKRALVTAAGQGIGRATAIAFAAAGARVVAADIDVEALGALEDERIAGLETMHLDVTNRAAIRELAEARHGDPLAFNVLFNCAGVVHSGSVLECSDEDWQAAWMLNVSSMFWLCQSLLPAMLEAGGGSIINVASIASSVKGVPNRCAYSATKAAVIGLTKSIAADFVGRGIRCNAICPGTIATPSLEARIRAQAEATGRTSEEVTVAFRARQPMGRLGTPGEIAALALYLASDESSFTTGAIHVADGGWTG